jgi:hypothetical protein
MGQLKIDRVDPNNSDNILVWAGDKFVKTRSLSDAVMDLFPIDADPDPENELQNISKEGDNIILDRDGGMVTLLDDDPTNELFDGCLDDIEFKVRFGGNDALIIDNQSRVGIEGILGVNAPSTSTLPAFIGIAQDQSSMQGINNSPTFPTLFIQNQNATGPAVNIVGNTFIGNGTNTRILFDPNPNAVHVAQFFGNQYVQGDIQATGTITGSSKSFLIDHPLEPKTKQLRHFSIESDQLTNIYKGNVILDDKGEGWVEMPKWFEALNTDYTYQLTCIGGYANVYIGEEIMDNKFKVAGGKSGLKVSWEVSGIRHDKAAQDIDQTIEIAKK